MDFYSLVGCCTCLYLLVKSLLYLYDNIKAFISLDCIDFCKFGKWAVVTGATDGIGKEYAFQLAKKGMSIVLISRNPEKLSDVAQEIELDSKVETKCVAIDFSESHEIYDKVESELRDMDIGVVVNNVGMSFGNPEFHHLVDIKTIRNLTKVNCESVTEMTHLIIPKMLEKKKGIIINISSASSTFSTPLLTLYAATKSFVSYFSESLDIEYRSKGLIIQTVLPFFVCSKMSGFKRPSFFTPSAADYVSQALRTVGAQRTTFGYYSHAIQGLVFSSLPKFVLEKLTVHSLVKTRERALKRAAKKNVSEKIE